MADASYPKDVIARWEKFGLLRHRPQRDRRNPCAICGWGPHMAIHRPVISGERAGETFGHDYVPYVAGVASASTSFSDFIRNGTPERKAEVYGRVMDKVAEQQQAVIDGVAVAAKTGDETGNEGAK